MDLTSSPTGIKLSTLPAAAVRSRRPLYIGLALCLAIGLLLTGGFLVRFLGTTAPEQSAASPQKVFAEGDGGAQDAQKSGEEVLKDLGLDGATPKAPTAVQNASAQIAPKLPPSSDDPTVQPPAGNPFDRWLGQGGAGDQGSTSLRQQQVPSNREPVPLSPEEQLRLESYNREYEALHKPLTGVAAALSAPTRTGTIATPPASPDQTTQRIEQQDQVVTIKDPETRRPYIKAGTWIEARLDATAVTDLPGDLHGRITTDVVGQHNGEPVKLIPMGATLIGNYSSRLAYGQDRLMQAWSKIIFADGRSISLPDVAGTDSTGAAGLKDKTDSHFSKLARDAGLLTIFSVGIALTQRNQSLLTTPSIGNTIGQSVGGTLGEIGSQLIGRNMALQPTGIFRPGGEFRILVKHDIIFAGKL
jgi:type IV secretory pathway VirB10-like protein